MEEEPKYPVQIVDNENSEVEGRRILYELRTKSYALKNIGEDPLNEVFKQLEGQQDESPHLRKVKSPRAQKILSPEEKQNIDEINRMLTQKDGMRRKLSSGQRVRMRFSEEEIENLFKGVARLGVGCWADIKNKYSFVDRKPIDLKDKWRNLLKYHPEETVQRLDKEVEDRRKRRAEKNKPEKPVAPKRRRGRKSSKSEPELELEQTEQSEQNEQNDSMVSDNPDSQSQM